MRRITLSLLAGAAVLVGPALAQQNIDFSRVEVKTTDLGNKTYLLEGAGGNVTVAVGTDGIIMVDSQFAPMHTYSGGTKIVQVGGRKAQLNHVYNSHTDGDTWVFFDDANVLDTRDTFGNTGRYNTIDFANGGDIRGLIRAADAYIKVSNDQTKIVAGHGKLATKADMIAWREMLITSRDRVQKLINEGKTEQEVLAAKPLADLNAKWAANDEQAKNWTRMVYNSFKRS